MFSCIKSKNWHFRGWCCNAMLLNSYVSFSDAPKFESKVGLAVHTQLNIKRKLDLKQMRKVELISNTNEYLSDNNALILQTLKRYCLEAGISAAFACNCSLNDSSETMKDLYCNNNQSDKGFQNIASNGYINFVVPYKENTNDSYQHSCKLKHLKLKYNQIDNFDASAASSFFGLPPMSIALLKIVFEPDLNNGTEAAALIEELISIMKRIIIDPCEIEGKFYIDFAIAVIRNGNTCAYKTGIEQIKNPTHIQRVIDYELKKQMLHFNSQNGNMAEIENVSYNTIKNISKQDNAKFSSDLCVESSPELHTVNIDCLQKKVPALPESERAKLTELYDIQLEIVDKLVKSDGLREAFEYIVSHINDKSLVYNFLLNNVQHKLSSRQLTFEKCGLSFAQIAEIIQLVHSMQISIETADDILEMLFNGDERSAKEIVENYNWFLISDDSTLEKSCNLVLSMHKKEARKFRTTRKGHHMNFLFNALCEITNRASRTHAEEMFKKLIFKKRPIAKMD